MTAAAGLMQVRIKRISFEAESINSYELIAPGGHVCYLPLQG